MSSKLKIHSCATPQNSTLNLLPQDKAVPNSKLLNIPEIGMKGLVIALIILLTWSTSLGLLLTVVNVSHSSLLWNVVALLWQTFLYTGLFIIAHDAMHGAVWPKQLKVNAAIGSFALLAYGLFSYKKLSASHSHHHCYTASSLDPDFHNGKSVSAIAWYFCFMRRYWSWRRFAGLGIIFYIMHSLFNVIEINLILFWIVPSLISSVQLFYFGTFLPHREPDGGYADSFHSQSTYFPLFWSFLACYHFGYHHEHHQYPNLAWWQLPKVI